eukprot:TRINITY_DN1350_c0_g1_i13.p1 TRINITY_DN1350_c0_g1~~TRINITY_DN1350_c0_g1_i13.p1  ORF type:complete len:119 (+),score=16.01 TRINITY_DN1350_c0_g1_i13:69-425(+)
MYFSFIASSLMIYYIFFFFFFKQKTAYEMLRSLVGSEMCIRDSSRKVHTSPSQAYGTLRYRMDKSMPSASVYGLSPGTSSAQGGLTRPVSYYAFFKGWLLLSQPPGCLGLLTSFPTKP